MPSSFDPGPPPAYANLFAGVPDYKKAIQQTGSDVFWYAFGPIFYRGRLDGSAQLLAIASDPGPTECLPMVRRCLVGDAGQRTQGFLAKCGLTQSYVLVNAFAYALHPSHAQEGVTIIKTNMTLETWRHQFYDKLLVDNSFKAIVSLGAESHAAYDVWSAANGMVAKLPAFKLPHPSALDRGGPTPALVKKWRDAVDQLRMILTNEGGALPANYGTSVTAADYDAIPRNDLGAKAYTYIGNGNAFQPPHYNSGKRPSPDDGTSLWLVPPSGQGQKLRYEYEDGKLQQAHDEYGNAVATDADGIPT